MPDGEPDTGCHGSGWRRRLDEPGRRVAAARSGRHRAPPRCGGMAPDRPLARAPTIRRRRVEREPMTWRVVVDFDLCESNAVCMASRPRCSRSATTTSSTSSTRPRPRSCAPRSKRRCGAARSRPSPSPRTERPARRDRGRHRSIVGARLAGLHARRGAARGRLRRPAHRGRRRAAPRPTTGRRCPSRCSPATGSDDASRLAGGASRRTSTSTGGSARAPPALDLADRSCRLGGRRRASASTGCVDRHRRRAPRLPGTARRSTACTCCAPSTTASRPARRARRRARAGGGGRRRLHRRRGGGHLPGPRARGHHARGAARAARRALGPRDGRGARPTSTATTASTCASASGVDGV